METMQVWFQNRRAKWRKVARLSLLQDAWRLRCLGLTNSSSSIIQSEHQRHSPKSDNTPSSPLPLITQNVSNSHLIGDIKSLKEPSEECEQSSNKNDGFTLMHPAFQNVLHKRKYYGAESIGAAGIFDRNSSDHRDQNLLTNVMQPAFHRNVDGDQNARKINSSKNPCTKNDCANSELSPNSSCSEEIDLTSSGCIDFSNNNNDLNSNRNKKVNNV